MIDSISALSNAQILEIGQRTVGIEIATLEALKASLNEDFVAVVREIIDCRGRVVVTGVGKSALIAQKIVATLNSTGTPALFLHAADAIHGDLGMIRPNDVVICLSKSGETSEIRVLVPLVKNMGNLLVGMVSNRASYLGRNSNLILHTPVEQEADPNNLAPTASSTAQTAMGDALAIALIALRGFTPQDFAQYHPGGSLGKQLYLRVKNLYTHNPHPAISPADSIQRTILEITSKCLGATVVIDEQHTLLGIITDGDLRRMLERGGNFLELCAADIMTASPKTIEPDAMAVQALELMRHHHIMQLVVAEEGKYLGIIHIHDLIREGLV
jgi:arabinose-5-phosphate isomerase